jgi:hypothetical protein
MSLDLGMEIQSKRSVFFWKNLLALNVCFSGRQMILSIVVADSVSPIPPKYFDSLLF